MTVPFLSKKDFAYGAIVTPPSPALTGQNFTISNADGFVLPVPSASGNFVIVYKRYGDTPGAPTLSEKILVTGGIQTNSTSYEVTACTRGYNGTTAQAIAAGGIVMLAPVTDHLLQYEKLLLPTIRYVNGAEGGYAKTPTGIRAAIAAGPGEVHVDGPIDYTSDGSPILSADDVEVYWHGSSYKATSSASAATMFNLVGQVSSGVVLAANASEGAHYIEVSAANIASLGIVEGSVLRIGASNFPGYFTCRTEVIDSGSTPNKIYIDRPMPLAALTANSATVYKLAAAKNFKMHDLIIDMTANTHASSYAMTRAYMDAPVLENVKFQNCAVGMYDYDSIIDPSYENVRVTRCGSSDHDPDIWGSQDHSVSVSSFFMTSVTGAKLDRVQAFYNDGGFAISIEGCYYTTGDQVVANGNQGRGFKTLDIMYATFTNACANTNGATGLSVSGVAKKVTFISPQANGNGGAGFGTPDNIAPATSPIDIKVIGGTFTFNNQAGNAYDIDLSAVSIRFKFIDCQFDTIRDLGTENSVVFTDRNNDNALVNGGFDFFQRQIPATATSYADQAYGPDRWKVLTQTSTIKANRAAGSASAGYGSRYCVQLTQEQAVAQRFALQQILSANDSIKYRGRSMFFKVKAKISGSSPTNDCTLKVAIIEWTGTADSVPADPIGTWTSTTYTINNFFANTTYTIAGIETLSLLGGASLASVLVKATISASANNVFVLVWTESTVAQNIVLTLETAHAGESSPLYSPPSYDEELRRAEYYCQKSYNIDTAPGDTNNNVGICSFNIQTAEASGPSIYRVPFRVRMRTTPTALILYDYAGTSGKITELSTNITVVTAVTPSVGAVHVGEGGFGVTHDPSGNIGGIMYHYLATAEL